MVKVMHAFSLIVHFFHDKWLDLQPNENVSHCVGAGILISTDEGQNSSRNKSTDIANHI